jgi:(p)ppGpp synthase/HD superfamily hydrolase
MIGIHEEDWYKSALELVRRRHKNQLDPLGWSFSMHFERVANRLIRLFPDATRAQVEAALLHDALQPGNCSTNELREKGITEHAIEIIETITLPTDGRSYLEYVADLVATANLAAIQVKLADNLDAFEYYSTRTSDEAKKLLETKFEPSRRMLQDALSTAE